jgi:hypothetical protein
MSIVQLEASTDPTGALSTVDLNTQDISNLIDNFNQLQSQLQGGNITQNPQNIIVFDGTANRVLIGFQTVLQLWGLFVSLPGVDVTTATANQLLFNSNQDVFNIIDKIPSSIPQFNTTYGGSETSGGVLLTVPHGQTFTPIVEVYVQGQLINFNTLAEIASSYVPLPIYNVDLASYVFPNATSSKAYPLSITFAVDSTNVYIEAYYVNTGDSHDTIAAIPLTIFVLQESAAT